MACSSRKKVVALSSSRYARAAGFLVALGLACGAAQGEGAKEPDASDQHKKVEMMGAPTMAASPSSTLAGAAQGGAARASGALPNGSETAASGAINSNLTLRSAARAVASSPASSLPGVNAQMLQPAIQSGRLSAAPMASSGSISMPLRTAARMASVAPSPSAAPHGFVSTAVLQSSAVVHPGTVSASTMAVAERSSVRWHRGTSHINAVKMSEHQRLPK